MYGILTMKVLDKSQQYNYSVAFSVFFMFKYLENWSMENIRFKLHYN